MATNTVLSTETDVLRRRGTYEEYLATASETRIVEWADGEIIEYMPPTIEHQDLIGFLVQLLGAFVAERELGKVVACQQR